MAKANPWTLEFTDEEAVVLERLEAILTPEDFNAMLQVMWQMKFHDRPSYAS